MFIEKEQYSSKNKRLLSKLEYIYEYLKSLRKVSFRSIENRVEAL